MDIQNPYKKKNIFGPIVGYFTFAAIIAVLFFFLIYPVAVICAKAFWTSEGFTFKYFELLFSNRLQIEAIENSFLIGIAVTFICILMSLPLALINSRLQYWGKAMLSGLLLVPMVMPPFVGAIGIQRFFARRGSVNLYLLENGWIDAPIDWLGTDLMFWAVVVLEVLHLYPIMYLNVAAAIANVDPSLDEAAKISGAPWWKRFLTITTPLSMPGIFAGSIIVFIWALTDLGTPLIVGFHETMPVRIFNMVTDVNENPVGFALVCLVILITVSVFVLSKYAFGSKKYNMIARGHVTSPVRPANTLDYLYVYPLFLGVIVLALIPHISVIITSLSDDWFMTVLPEAYTTKYYQTIFSDNSSLALIGIKNSFLLAIASTLLDCVLGVMVAYVVVRKLFPLTGALDSIVMIPLALPGIVLAFGYVVTYTDTFLDPLYNPIPLLIIAYAIRRLPFMVRSAAAGFEQTSISLEEASATFGASKLHTMRKIVIPLVMANLIAGGLLCFAYAMLDVSDSLILAMQDRFYPMTKAIYALFLEQGSGEFIASALGVVGMGILTACIIGASMLLGKKMGELFRS